ncbi:uncharacterized protein LOC117592064 [Drosophila guanche]|uniref:Uncharacterized protein n=1 Tax=Drosophila guanche TaxID=7266 RepID=A0A3B0JQ81_DROGU|nr:uncharacterized protein LOC117592064 [Drosophila guanche]SPP74811.1 Hypothetical predicted protein [Drosophila guanche]
MASFGHITKLVVNIGNGETRMSYGDAYTRVIYANPSGLCFPSGLMDLDLDPVAISQPNSQDNRYRPESFLRRHFALLAKRLPQLMGVSTPDASDVEDTAADEAVVWYNWHLEEAEYPEPQWVKFLEWTEPEKGRLEIFNRFWHLDSCVDRNKSETPRCCCLKIKQTMDHIKELIGPELQDASMQALDFDSTMRDVNDSLKQLQELMELQEQRNRTQA